MAGWRCGGGGHYSRVAAIWSDGVGCYDDDNDDDDVKHDGELPGLPGIRY